MGTRPYTGYDGDASGKRAGLEAFVKLTSDHFGGGVWNNGTWGIRNMNKPGKSRKSVHSTGRAADMSWYRNAKWKGKVVKRSTNAFGDYKKALQVPEFWLDNADLFLIEEVHDYYPSPFGRGWRCTRNAWKSYQKQMIGNTPGGTWFHVEIAPAYADDAAYYKRAFAQALGKPVPKPKPTPGGQTGSGGAVGKLTAPSGRPELTKAEESIVKPAVRSLQRILVAEDWAVFTNVDGRFGNKTFRSVKNMQGALGFSGKQVDGRYGPNTAGRLTAYLAGGS